MAKKVIYHIHGFDCPHCAAKCEQHLNKQEQIESATIDFSCDRMYIDFKEEELTIDELQEIIKKVEEDKLTIQKIDKKQKAEEQSIFDKEFFINLTRIVISLILALITKFVVGFEERPVLALVLYSVALVICLYDIFLKVIKNIIKLNNPIDMNLLLTISSVGVITLGSLIRFEVIPEGPFMIDLFDGVLVVALYQVGELFEHIASIKSKKAIRSAINLRADTANLFKDGEIIQVEPEKLQIGDKIVVNVGDIIPVDAVVIDGKGSLDTASLTGESLPLEVNVDSQVLSGEIVKSGSLILRVEKVYSESTVSKILELVENSGEHKAKAEKFITKFAKVYTPTVFAIGIAYALIYGFITNEWTQAIFCGLAILVVSCPCAIVISVPLAFFAGVGLASRKGIIIKGSNYLDALCNIGTLFVDKTGTLTYGNFQINEIYAVENKDELLETLYAAESRSNHPLARAICANVDARSLTNEISSYEELAGEGIKAVINNEEVYVGKAAFLVKNSVKVEDFNGIGTVIHVAKSGHYLGYVVLKDTVREDAKQAVENLHKLGIKVILLSGDKKDSVVEVSKGLGIDDYHYELLPQDKTQFIEDAEKHSKGKLTAFAGDGINDTPSIMRAGVGIAMGGIGSDVAIENADVVIMQDNPNKIYDAIKVAKKTRRVALFNIIFSLFIKVSVIVLVLTGVLKQYGMIIAVLADTGLTVVMIINSLLLIYRKI